MSAKGWLSGFRADAQILRNKFKPTEKKGSAGLFDLSRVFWNTYVPHIENKYSTVHTEPVLKDALSHLGHLC